MKYRDDNSIYICGPMTNVKGQNFPSFIRAERRINTYQPHLTVFNPVSNILPADCDSPWRVYMHMGIMQLIQCSNIYLLRDWELSKGARLEFDIAANLKFDVQFEIADERAPYYDVPWEQKS